MNDLIAWSSYSLRWTVLPQLVFGALLLAQGIFVWAQNRRAAVNRSFLFLAAAEWLWLTGFGFGYLSVRPTPALVWFSLGYAGVLFIPTAAYVFSVFYLRARWQQPLAAAAVVFSALFTALLPWISDGLYRYPWGFYIRLGKTNIPFLLYFALMAGLFMANLHRVYRTAPTARERHIHGGLLTVTALAYLGALDYLPAYGFGVPFLPIGFVPNAIFVSAMGYLLVRHRLVPLRTLLYQTLGYIVFTVLLALLYVSTFGTLEWLSRRPTHWSEFFTGLFLFLGLLYAFAPLKAWTERLVERLFHREIVDIRDRVHQFVSRLRWLTYRPQLESDLFHLLLHDFNAVSCTLLRREPGGDAFTPSRRGGTSVPGRKASFPLSEWQSFFRALESSGQVVTREQLLADPAYEPIRDHGTRFCELLRAELIVPITQAGRLQACVTVGSKRRGGYVAEEIELLQLAAGAASVALENAALLERVQDISRLKSNFVSLASHQLRTPVSELKWALNSLMSGDAGPLPLEQRELVQRANVSNERLVKLIGDLLDVAKLESGTTALQLGDVALASVAEEIRREYEPLASRLQVTIRLDAERADGTVQADAPKIRQVLGVLVENAIRYNRPGGEVKISLHQDRGRSTIAVSDTGMGIPRHEQSKVFTTFFRGVNASSRYTEGTGLGLYSAQQILQAHGSELFFRSHENIGSTFSFTLPGANPAITSMLAAKTPKRYRRQQKTAGEEADERPKSAAARSKAPKQS